jgi:hypothetical protein
MRYPSSQVKFSTKKKHEEGAVCSTGTTSRRETIMGAGTQVRAGRKDQNLSYNFSRHSNEMMSEQTTEQTTEEGPMPLALLTIKKEGSD